MLCYNRNIYLFIVHDIWGIDTMSSPIKRLVQYHIKRLEDKNPEVRIKAIKELELLYDEDALEALKLVYDNDNNDAVRQAAKTAGRTIFMHLRSSSEADETASGD